MKCIILVPTRNRMQKLSKMIDSAKSTKHDISFLICADGEHSTEKRFGKEHKVLTFKNHAGSVKIRNDAIRYIQKNYDYDYDCVLFAVDDIIFNNNSIDNALDALLSKYPNKTGMVGFQIDIDKKLYTSGVVVLWKDMINKYPNGDVFFPNYYHFAVQELKRLGTITNLLYECQNATILHDHPGRTGAIDQTHKDARKYRDKDKSISKTRREDKKTWAIEYFKEFMK